MVLLYIPNNTIVANKKVHVYLYGDIMNEQAPIASDFGIVSLNMVKQAVDRDPSADEIVAHIHSNGGNVYEGFAIHDYLVNTGKKITTIVEGLCCSIATVVFMAGTERLLTENSRFLIHNPWCEAEGNASDFRKVADELEEEEVKLLNFYTQKTGADPATITAYMDADKLLSPQTALELKFATKVVNTMKAMAMYRLQTTKNTIKNKMDKKKISNFNKLLKGLKALANEFKDEPEPQAANKQLADGSGALYFDGTLAEGTPVFSDEAMTMVADDGDYEFQDGTTVTVDDGKVTEVLEPDNTDQTNEDPQNEKAIKALKDKVAALEAEKLELEAAFAESEIVMASAEKALKLAKSTYVPEKRENSFKKKTDNNAEPDFKEKLEARRKELREKRAKK
jgi:ATP-dependent protease ClpP protease subunit